MRGTGEVFWPVFSSTLTTIAAFLPMLIMVGVTGEFFSIIPKVVVGHPRSLRCSSASSSCPIHYLEFGQRFEARRGGQAARPARRPDPMDDGRRARRCTTRLSGALRSPSSYATVVWLLSLSIITVGVAGRLDTLLFPSDFQVMMVNMELPPGASLAQNAEATKAVDEFLHLLNEDGPYAGELDAWTTSMGAAFSNDNYLVLAPHVAQAFVSLRQGSGVDPVAVKDYATARMQSDRDRAPKRARGVHLQGHPQVRQGRRRAATGRSADG